MDLTPEHIEMMVERHGIDPISPTPWIKGFTGGSDDHAGLFIGQTATPATVPPPSRGFSKVSKTKKTRCWGRCNDYKSFAFPSIRYFVIIPCTPAKQHPAVSFSLSIPLYLKRNRAV